MIWHGRGVTVAVGALLLAVILSSCDNSVTVEPPATATAEPSTPSAAVTPGPWNVRLTENDRTQLNLIAIESPGALSSIATSPDGGPGPASTTRLAFADQIGGTAYLLGDIDGEIVASIGGRIHRFKVGDTWSRDIRASSPLLPGMPTAFVRVGAFAVVGTSRGLSILEIEETDMPIVANFALGNVQALAVHKHHVLALLDDSRSDDRRLAVVDLGDPLLPATARILELPDRFRSLAIVGPFAYLAGGGSGLGVLDLERVDEPLLLSPSSWPWSNYDKGYAPYLVAGDSRRLFVVAHYDSDEPDRACVFAFEVAEHGVLTLLGSLPCPGHVDWVQAVGYTLLVMGQEGADVLLLDQASVHAGDSFLRGIYRWDGIVRSTAVQIGGEVIIAHDRDLQSEVDLHTLRVSGLGGPERTFNSLQLKAPSVHSFHSVDTGGTSLLAMPEWSGLNAIHRFAIDASGHLERIGQAFDIEAEDLVADADKIYTAQNADVDVFQLSASDASSLLRHVGVIQPELVGCVEANVEMNIRGPTCTPLGIMSMQVDDSLLVMHHGSPALPPYSGPLAYDVSDPRRPDFMGALPADVLVATTTQAGRSLPRPVRVEFLLQDRDQGSGLFAVVWADDLAYLVHSMCLNPHMMCKPGSVEVRDPARDLSGPAISTLELPYVLAMAVGVETPGGPLLVAASADPEPGLYLVDISDPHLPSIDGFIDLPAMPSDIAVSGNFVVVAAGDAGLIVFALQ